MAVPHLPYLLILLRQTEDDQIKLSLSAMAMIARMVEGHLQCEPLTWKFPPNQILTCLMVLSPVHNQLPKKHKRPSFEQLQISSQT